MGISLDKSILGITGEQDKGRLYGHQSRQVYPGYIMGEQDKGRLYGQAGCIWASV